MVYYLVEWNPTLVPKYTLKNVKEMVNKFEARLRAQARQEKGTGRTAVVKGIPADHAQSSGNKENTVEEAARSTSEAGEVDHRKKPNPFSRLIKLERLSSTGLLILCVHTSLLFLLVC